jgi:methylated-DNA-protein-cysteine methyltransferase-like protein
VQCIPRGRVSTYGQVATEAGFPGNARLVGYALHALPPESGVPWQRVINSRGQISFPKNSRAFTRQMRLLKGEGIRFVDGRIDLQKLSWFNRIKIR